MAHQENTAASDPLGSAAEEAVRLVDALRELVTGPGAEHLATGSSECQVCPICRAISLLRDADPQAVGRVADSVVAVAGTVAAIAEPLLRSLVDTAVSTAQAAAGTSDPETPSAPATDTDTDTDTDTEGEAR